MTTDKVFKRALLNKNFPDAFVIISASESYQEVGHYVYVALSFRSSQKILEASLQKFFDLRITEPTEQFLREHIPWINSKVYFHFTAKTATWKHCRVSPHEWTKSLSDFTGKLWDQRRVEWIKRFYEAAFFGANELEDPGYSDRLILDFAKYARWDDNPADFHIIPENIRWMDWRCNEKARLRIEHGPFESEEAFLQWKEENK